VGRFVLDDGTARIAVVENAADIVINRAENRLYEYTREPTERQRAFLSRSRRRVDPGVAYRFHETRLAPGSTIIVSGLVRRDYQSETAQTSGYRERPYRLVMDWAPEGYLITDTLSFIRKDRLNQHTRRNSRT
jgi:hypothetical protein